MHDILEYVSKDPVYRRWDHQHLTFSLLYAFSENFILPFSHDEVVHGKGSMFGKIPGDEWQKAATLRALYGFMYAHPGKKLMFMGCEFGQWREWNHDQSLDWHLLDEPLHAGLQRYVQRSESRSTAPSRRCTRSISIPRASSGSTATTARTASSRSCAARRRGDYVVAVMNFTPVPREGYRIGVPDAGTYVELINSDADVYGGSNVGNGGGCDHRGRSPPTARRSRSR